MRIRRSVYAVLTLVVVLATLLGVAGAAFAAPPAPDAWVGGPVPPWGWMRFDGQYYAPLNRVYFLSGRVDAAASITPRVWYFNVATSAFVDTTVDMPTGVANYHIVQLTDATGPGLFVFGGSTAAGTYSTQVQVYRPEANTAAVVAGDTWPGEISPGCSSFPGAAVSYNNKAYILGGFNSACGVTNQVWIYDPMAAAGSRFTAGPPLTMARGYIQVAVVDNYLYALGGDDWDGASLIVTPRTERLDLTNPAAVWDDAGVAEMPVLTASGLAGCDENEAFGFNTVSGTELHGKIVIAGCGQWTAEYDTSFIYDVATNTWAEWEPLTIARRNYAGALVSTPTSVAIWIFGGRSGADVGLASTEYRTVAITPTSVQLTGIESRTNAGVPLWALAMAGVLLLAGGVGVLRARATR